MTYPMRTVALRPEQARARAPVPLRRSLLLWLLLVLVCLLVPACHGGSAPGPTPGPGTDPGLPLPGHDEATCPALSDTLPLLPPALPHGDTVRAGALPGAFSVASTGEARYTLPLVVPPGRAGGASPLDPMACAAADVSFAAADEPRADASARPVFWRSNETRCVGVAA